MTKIEYDIVDYFKFFFALCVVGIHANILTGSLAYPLVFRVAVPYFFVASGFFIGKKFWDGESKGKLNWGGVKRLIIKLLVFEPISIVLITIQLFRQGTSESEIIEQLFKHILFYPYGALWYIQALIVALPICFIFLKRYKIQWLIVISMLLYLFALICNNYYFLSEHLGLKEFVDHYLELFVSPRNGLFVGLFFVSTGIAIAKYEIKIQLLTRINHLLLISAFLFLIMEAYLLKDMRFVDDGGLFLSYALFVPLLFILTITIHKLKLPNAKYIRNLSTSIYLIHRPLLMILVSFTYNVFGESLRPSIAFVVTVVMAIGFSIVAYRNATLYKILT